MAERGPGGMSKAEFIALIAMLFSTIAFSVDSLLPAFPQIAQELGPTATGRVYLLITIFMAGLALGTLVAGPISDAIGRRSTMFISALLFLIAGTVAWLSTSFEIIVAARFVQGVGAAGPRVVSLAIVRDLYKGRAMAQIMSLALVLFAIVPTLAPAMGDILANAFGWRSILLAFLLFCTISTLWIWFRLDEPLKPENRRPLRLQFLMSAAREILSHPVVRLSILTQSTALGLMFCLLVTVQPIFDEAFNRADSFPYWFGGIALVSAASTSLLNARLVLTFGMQRLVTLGMGGQVLSAALTLLLLETQPAHAFEVFIAFQFMLIWLTGLCIGNLNALAMEPMGHIAGFTASVTGAVSTMIAALVASYVGALFDGTPIPLVLAVLCLAFIGFLLMLRMRSYVKPGAIMRDPPL